MAYDNNGMSNSGTDWSSILPMFQKLLATGIGVGTTAATGGAFGSQGAGTLGLGAIQAIPSLINLIRLSKQERPNYTVGPEQQGAYNTALQRSRQGFTPQQTGAFQQNLAQAQNTDYYNARNMAGGGLAGAISAGLTGRRLGALNQFAGQDAQQQGANVNSLYGQAGNMQRQRNLRTQQDVQYRLMKEGAQGAALSSGLTNLASGVNANQALGLGFGKGLKMPKTINMKEVNGTYVPDWTPTDNQLDQNFG